VLKFMRRNAQSMVVRFVFVAIVVVFVFWGVGVVGDERGEMVASVDGEVIDPVQFDRTYVGLERSYRQIYKDEMPPELYRSLDLKGKALDQLIRVSLFRQEARRLGLQVSDAEVAESIQSLPVFQDGGLFTKERYLAVLRANAIAVSEFEEAQRDELLVRKMEDIIGAGAVVSDAELRELFHLDSDRIDLQFARIKASQFTDQVVPTDDDLQAHYEAHKEQFRVSERVRIEYVRYGPDAFLDQVSPSDAEIQDYYDTHREQYEKPEEVQARHILFRVNPEASEDEKNGTRQIAQEVLAKAQAGEDFAALAEQHSQDEGSAARGGDLGLFKRGQMVPPFEQAAFALEPGAVSDLVESPFGLHIIKVEAKHPAETRTVDQVRSEIVGAIKQERGREIASDRAIADRDRAQGNLPLAEIARESGLGVLSPEPFTLSEPIEGIGREPKLNEAAFAASPGQIPDVVQTTDAHYVFRLVERIPSRIPDLSEVRAAVEQAFRKQRSEELAKGRAEALLPQLQQQRDLAALAAANGLVLEESGPFTRTGTYVPKLGAQPDLKKVAFQLTPENPVASGVYQSQGDAILAVLKESLPADDAKFEEQKETLRQQALARRQGTVNEQFLNRLKAKARIELNPKFLANVSDTGYVPPRR
jgi:peptidyl-prolyl cis-trans isomerase D